MYVFVAGGHNGYSAEEFNVMRHRTILRDEVAARLLELGNVSLPPSPSSLSLSLSLCVRGHRESEWIC